MDDTLGVLQVEPLAQQVGRDQHVGLESRDRRRATLRPRREGAQHLLPGRLTRRKAAGVSKHRGDASMTQPLQQVSRRGLSVSKDDRFDGPFGEQTFQRVSFGITRRRARQQPAQSREDAPIAREWPWTTSPVIEQQGEQDELNVGLGGTRKAAMKLLRRQRAPLGGGARRESEI